MVKNMIKGYFVYAFDDIDISQEIILNNKTKY